MCDYNEASPSPRRAGLTFQTDNSINSSGNFQDFSYRYDKFGNLAARNDNINDVEETFTYDDIDRLTGVTLRSTAQSRPVHSEMRYDEFGRMTMKQMDGRNVFNRAQFSTGKPHAMEFATAYEPMLANVGQTVEYTSFDKVSRVKRGAMSLSYVYGIGDRRVGMTENVGHYVRTKKYVGNCEFVSDKGCEKVLTYLTGPYGVFAAVVEADGVESLFYLNKDNLGSWTTITDSEGRTVQRQSFDAWGNRRNSKTWLGAATDEPLFDRGYTGHEHLYNFGLINMNGRMYDPMTSSFLSPDNYVQDPTSQQGFNRYAYCFYNPLRYTDPTGERAFGPAWYELLGAAEEYVMQERRRMFNMGMTHIYGHSNDASDLFNSICTWGDKEPANTGGNYDGSSGGDKSNGGMMQADTGGAPAE